MKRFLLTLTRIFLLSSIAFASLKAQNCTFTELNLNSQTAVSSFDQTCKRVVGNIKISGANITDLSPLKNIEIIVGRLTIQDNANLATLTGLEKLASVQTLLIYSNNALSNLSGLEGLGVIWYSGYIRYNNNLTSLTGLDHVEQAGALYISNNDQLAGLTGLTGLKYVTDLLSIAANKALLTLNGLTSLIDASRIIIGENDKLTDLSGLETLQSVSYQMYVKSNKNLKSLRGLDKLAHLSEVYISDNDLMTDLSGLEGVKALYWLVIGESQGLSSLNGLQNLTSATNMIIRDNSLLTDLSGLDNITNIGSLQLARNSELISLSGLGATNNNEDNSTERTVASLQIGALSIIDNPKLTTCAVSAVCDFISTNEASIRGNGTGCDSEAAVELACTSLPVTVSKFTADIENSATLLHWATTEESNSFLFEIEHSLDAKTWTRVGENAAKGESNKLVNYQWRHRSPSVGTNYYRLKMIDLDGSYAYSRITSVKIGSLTHMFVYPNPVSETLFVIDQRNIISLQILDLQGKTVHLTREVPRSGVPVKTLTKGIYQVKIIRKGGVIDTQRVAVL